MGVKWDLKESEYYINEKIGKQTFHMAFQESDASLDTIYLNIYMTLYNKRSQIDNNENHVKMTGLNPWKTVCTAIKCFNALEKEALIGFKDFNIIIYCTWLDNRRRDAYYNFLSRRGYQYGNVFGEKCIFKKFKKGFINKHDL